MYVNVYAALYCVFLVFNIFLFHTAMKPVEVKLHLAKLRDRQWYVQPSCATSGDELYEGLA